MKIVMYLTKTLFCVSVLLLSGERALAASKMLEAPADSIERVYQYPMIWASSLNYTFKGQVVLDSENVPISVRNTEWHREKQGLLQEIESSFSTQNVAFSRLGVIYKEKGSTGNYRIEHYEIPFLFISGWSSEELSKSVNLQEICDAYELKGIFGIKESGDIKAGKKAYLEHLLGCFTPDPKSFDPGPIKEMLEKTRKDLITYSTTADFGGENFHSRFYDTEQGVFIHLKERVKETLKRPLSKQECSFDSDKHEVHGVVLEIASFLDMCIDCGITGDAQLNYLKGFYVPCFDYFFKSWLFDGEVPLPSFILISSQEPSRKGLHQENKWYSRGKTPMTNYNTQFIGNSGIIALEDFGKRVVQCEVRP